MAKFIQDYEQLKQRFHQCSAIEGALSVLQWDRAAKMPKGGADARAEQVATLETLHHKLLTSPEVSDWLESVEDNSKSLSNIDAANLREMRRNWVHAVSVPSDLVAALSKAAASCEMDWRVAREDANFSAVLPKLSELLALVQQKASVKSEVLGVSHYDALLDMYEPDGRSADIDKIFTDIAIFLPNFLDEVLERQNAKTAPLTLPEHFSKARQQKLVKDVMEAMGFDFDYGRLDESAHPFCGGIPDDVRLTTRYDEADGFSGLFGVIHETGHALYEMGLPKHLAGQPVGLARGMSMHESQSLCMEMQAGKSRAFLKWLAPKFANTFSGEGEAWSTTNLITLAQKVERGFIRVDADEVTYPAHVILRYRLERAMISGDLKLADLPAAWNDGLQDLLGITPPNDRLGCMQDIHWYDGAWGYFPTYTLGALTAAQLFAAAEAEVQNLDQALSQGDFRPLLNWLRTSVHEKGSQFTANEILTQATGKPLDSEAFKTHLRKRYIEDAK